jgi:1-phosphatidylinositol-4-phosphate 5-kinase
MFNANFQTLTELCSSGKSGSFFYYTSDGNFMLKTIRRDEFKMMKAMLKQYYDHLTITNPDSMISKILGLHKVIFYRKKHKMQKKIYFCIMNNVFNTIHKIDYRYDLKGSTQGRQTVAVGGQAKDHTIALKDLDFVNEKKKFLAGRDSKNELMKIIRKDAEFFARQGIIDYSLLVGVHDKTWHPV